MFYITTTAACQDHQQVQFHRTGSKTEHVPLRVAEFPILPSLAAVQTAR